MTFCKMLLPKRCQKLGVPCKWKYVKFSREKEKFIPGLFLWPIELSSNDKPSLASTLFIFVIAVQKHIDYVGYNITANFDIQ